MGGRSAGRPPEYPWWYAGGAQLSAGPLGRVENGGRPSCAVLAALRSLLVTDVVVPRRSIEAPALHAAPLESVAASRTGRDRYVRASRSAQRFPCTTRSPRFTWVSLGNPFRRLLVRSKAGEVVVGVLGRHGAPPSRCRMPGRHTLERCGSSRIASLPDPTARSSRNQCAIGPSTVAETRPNKALELTGRRRSRCPVLQPDGRPVRGHSGGRPPAGA